MTTTLNLSKLTDLAKETSSERRRELLRDVTDLYFANQNTSSEVENEHFSEILTHVTSEMDKEVRKEMAERFAKEPKSPLQLLRSLASDDFDIAGPVLRHSTILQDKHLKEVINSKGQQHLRAISSRESLSPDVTRDIVQRGDDETLVTLASNQGARFDSQSMQTMVNRSETVTALQAPLVEHRDLSPDLMNEMYSFAEKAVRARIVVRNQDIDPKALEEALNKVKMDQTGVRQQFPEGYHTAKHQIDALQHAGKLDGVALLRFERDGNRLKFTLGLAAMAKVDFLTIERILQRVDLDALALICRALEFDGALFVTIALLINQDDSLNTGNTGELRQEFDDIPISAAQRTLRFWQMRQKMETSSAA
jgi:uncharacterized protein (DUF2336 family)